MEEAVLIDGVRSPIGKYGGGLSKIRPDDLLAYVYRGLMDRIDVDPTELDEVFAGCGNQAGEDNRDVARMSALLAGFPKEIPGVTINRNCSSALSAVNLSARSILSGEGHLYIGSGVESMSRAPWSIPKPEKTPTTAAPKVYDTTVGWRYENPRLDEKFPIISLGQGAELIANEMQISRVEQDEFSLESHKRAVQAINDGKFQSEIIPITVEGRREKSEEIKLDEHPRYEKSGSKLKLAISMEDLAKLRPAFSKDGSVTAGNSSGINDGAAAILISSKQKAKELNLKPKLRWLGSSSTGTDPRYFGYGPVSATENLLKRFGLGLEDIGLVELNEAFAAQAIGCMQKLGLSNEITNVNGGAIALGHPTGCSGARILVTLMHEMERRAPNMPRPFYGIATLCVGVGMGEATLVEWIGD